MKDKKTLHKEVYVRIYDKKLCEKYDEIKSKRKEKLSDNEFAQELIKLGLGVLSSQNDDSVSYIENTNEIKRMLGVLIKEVRKQDESKSVFTEINNKKINAIHNLLVAQATGESVTEKEIEGGFYDNLPERFVDEIQKKGTTLKDE